MDIFNHLAESSAVVKHGIDIITARGISDASLEIVKRMLVSAYQQGMITQQEKEIEYLKSEIDKLIKD